MGIPGFFRWLSYDCRNSITEITDSTVTDNLYIDANGLIHDSASEIFCYGSNSPESRDPSGSSKCIKQYQSLEHAKYLIFERIMVKFYGLLSKIRVRKMIYFAIDGPAPRAKQNQQRQRRFSPEPASKDFDSNCITPGTMFMMELSRFLMYSFRIFVEKSGIPVLFSPPTKPGEGEHKIVEYIRKNKNLAEFKNSSHMFYGMDADLIILAMATGLDSVRVFRKDPKNGNDITVNVESVSRTVLHKSRYTKDDFVALSFFVGNDFLPKVQMFVSLDDGMKKLLSLSQNLGVGLTASESDRSTQLNLKGFQMLLKVLSDCEINYIISQHIKHDNRLIEMYGKGTVEYDLFTDDLLKKYVNRSNNTLDWSAYRLEYYKKCGIESESGVWELCKEYTRMFVWVYKYYTTGVVSWNELYSHHKAPFIKDLYLFVMSLKNLDFDWVLGSPTPAVLQLLSVLPPRSADLLPEEYRFLLSDPLSKMYEMGWIPKVVGRSYDGVFVSHQAHNIVPFLNSSIDDIYKSVTPSRDYKRNHQQTDFYLLKDEKQEEYTYVSDFGSIPMCKTKVLTLG